MATLAPDFLVEVRDRSFIRKGQIAPEYLDLKFVEVFRGVGSWQLKLPAEHPLLVDLKTKGSGIIITQRSSGHIFSGRTQSCVLSQNAEDPAGTWVITGADDGILAAATVVYPTPTAAANAQTNGYWTLTGAGEYVMKEAVRLNAGTGALASRKYAWLTNAAGTTRGTSVSASSRFDILGDLLSSIAVQSGLGWSFVQVGNGVVFDVFVPADKRALIQLDIRNGGLESTVLGYTAPSATKVLVMGQGEDVNRTIQEVTAAGPTAEAALWGLNWEQTKDQRNTNVSAELTAAGTEILTESGSTVNSLKVTPSDAPGQRLGVDWWLGDQVTVIIDGATADATVTQVATSVNSAGVIQQATVGDPVGYDWDAKVSNKLAEHEKRLDNVENYVGNPLSSAADFTVNNDLTVAGKVRLTNTGDVSIASTGHAFQVGLDSGSNIAIDNNEMQGRTNGVASTLAFQLSGGNSTFGDATSTFNMNGHLNNEFLPWAFAAGRTVSPSGGTLVGSIYYSSTITVTLPVGRFTQVPRITLAPTGLGVMFASVTGTPTTTSFQGVMMRLNASLSASSHYFEWMAVQMSSANANG